MNHANSALVYESDILHQPKLLDITSMSNLQHFRASKLPTLSYWQPDLFIFQHNSYIEDANLYKIAGCPDLIVEVWSDGNSEEDRQIKQKTYTSSPKTESWYIVPTSLKIKRFVGTTQLEDLDMSRLLVTQTGLQIDLSQIVNQFWFENQK